MKPKEMKTSNKPTHTHKKWLKDLKEILGLLLLVFLIRTFGFGLYQVPTGSMETTMLVGERFFADKLSYLLRTPRRQEIISMNAPEAYFSYSKNWLKNLFQNYVWGPDNWTKRIIATPGDEVRGTVEDGHPVIYLKKAGETEFSKMKEPYLNAYPLIHLYSKNPEQLRKEAEAKIAQYLKGQEAGAYTNPQMLEKNINKLLGGMTVFRSYDPCKQFDEQPFYRFTPSQIVLDEQGEKELRWPGNPKYSYRTTGSALKAAQAYEQGRNYYDGSDEFYVKLGPDQYWAMGDNRLGSEDCRVFGPVNGSKIHGRILFRIWSIDSSSSWWIFDLLFHPVTFFNSIRWNRFFQVIH